MITTLEKNKTNIETSDDEIVQYFIVNSELDMSAGKIAAQVAHVATIITRTCTYNYLFNQPDYMLFLKWFQGDQKKIILKGKKKDLLKLIENKAYYIRDNGLTEIPEGSLTCVGFKPCYKSEISHLVKRLRLY